MFVLINSKKYEIEKDDLWYHKQSGKKIISHSTIMRLARESGYKALKSELEVAPSNLNNMTIVYDCSIQSPEPQEIFHAKGEASDRNCPERSPGYSYLASMAEKRGFDRALLRAWGWDDMYSEVEAEDFYNEKPSRSESKREVEKEAEKEEEEEEDTITDLVFYLRKVSAQLDDKGEFMSKVIPWVRKSTGLPITTLEQIPISYLSALIKRAKEKLEAKEEEIPI